MPIDTVLASHHSVTWTDTQGRGYLLTSTQHTFLSGLRSYQPPALPTCLPPSQPLVPQIYGYQFTGRNSFLHLLYLKCPRSHLNSPRCHHKHSRHSVSALLFDKTVDTVQGQCWLHPTHLQGMGWALTPFIRLQLCLQVFRGYVEFCLLTLRGLGLAFPTAAVKTTAQTAAAVAAGEEATDDEQSLRERILALCSLKGP